MRRRARYLGVGLAALMTVAGSAAFAQSTGDVYLQALRKYRAGSYSTAARLFEELEKSQEPGPEVIKSHYFRARALMHLRDWKGASAELTSIYVLAPSFYADWSCDYLLGVCREHLGKG